MPSLDGRWRRVLQLASAVLTPVLGVEAVRQALAAPSGVDLACTTSAERVVCRPGAGGRYDRRFEVWLELAVEPAGAGWRAELTSGEPVRARAITDDAGRPMLVIAAAGDANRPLDPFTWGPGATLTLVPAGQLSAAPRVTDWKAHLVDAPMDSQGAQARRRRDHAIAWLLFVAALLPAAATVFIDEREVDAATLTDRLVRRCVDTAVTHLARADRRSAQTMLRDVLFEGASADQIAPPGPDGRRDSVRQLLFLSVSKAFIGRLDAVQGEIDRRLEQAMEAAEDVSAAPPPAVSSPAPPSPAPPLP